MKEKANLFVSIGNKTAKQLLFLKPDPLNLNFERKRFSTLRTVSFPKSGVLFSKFNHSNAQLMTEKVQKKLKNT